MKGEVNTGGKTPQGFSEGLCWMQGEKTEKGSHQDSEHSRWSGGGRHDRKEVGPRGVYMPRQGVYGSGLQGQAAGKKFEKRNIGIAEGRSVQDARKK